MSAPSTSRVEHGPEATPEWRWVFLPLCAILILNGFYHAFRVKDEDMERIRQSFENQTVEQERSAEVSHETPPTTRPDEPVTLEPGESSKVFTFPNSRWQLCLDPYPVVEPYTHYFNEEFVDGVRQFNAYQVRNTSDGHLLFYHWMQATGTTCTREN